MTTPAAAPFPFPSLDDGTLLAVHAYDELVKTYEVQIDLLVFALGRQKRPPTMDRVDAARSAVYAHCHAVAAMIGSGLPSGGLVLRSAANLELALAELHTPSVTR